MSKNNFISASHKAILQQSMNAHMELLDWQMIRDFITNRVQGISLSTDQEFKLKIYQYIYDQLQSYKYTEQEVVKSVERLFNRSFSQACADMRHAKEIFNTTLKINKLFEIKLQIDRLKIEQQKCINSGQSKDFALISKVIQSYIEMLPDDEDEMSHLFTGHTNMITFNPALLGIEPLSKSVLDEILSTVKKKNNFNDIISAIEIEEAQTIDDDAD